MYAAFDKLLGNEVEGESQICEDPTSAGFEKLRYEMAHPMETPNYLDNYELTVIEDRILFELELKLNPFIKKS